MIFKINRKDGKTAILQGRPEFMEKLYKNFGNKRFVYSEIVQDIGDNSFLTPQRIHNYLNILTKGQYICRKKIKRGNKRDSVSYNLSQKAFDYRKHHGSFYNGWFGKIKNLPEDKLQI